MAIAALGSGALVAGGAYLVVSWQELGDLNDFTCDHSHDDKSRLIGTLLPSRGLKETKGPREETDFELLRCLRSGRSEIAQTLL